MRRKHTHWGACSAKATRRERRAARPARRGRRRALRGGGMGRDATRAMGGAPIILASYSGVLGGAERVLLDCATRLERPVVIACPEGALAAAARTAGLAV